MPGAASGPRRKRAASTRPTGLRGASSPPPEYSKIEANLLHQLRIGVDQRPPDAIRLPRRLLVTSSAAVVLAAAVAGGWLFANRALAVQTAAAVAASAGAKTADTVLQTTGYVTARRRATVSTQITGTLTQVLFEEGDRVEAGQVIARLEDTGLRAALDAAQANVDMARAESSQAQVQLQQAQRDANRQAELASSGMVPKQAAEQSRSALDGDVAQLEIRRRGIESAQAQFAQARANLSYATVRAPFAGIITEKTAQVGEIVSPMSSGGFTRTGVGTIVDMDSLEVDVDVNEAYISQVRPDMTARAVFDAYPGWTVPAHVIATIPSADRAKATVKVRVALELKDPRIVPDMGAHVSFLGGKPSDEAAPVAGILAPREAIVERDQHATVFVVAQGRVSQRAVDPAARDVGAMKLIVSGIRAGEMLVLSPPPQLHDGSNVTVHTASEP